MKSRIFSCFVMLACLLLGAQPALAASGAVREMAGIMVKLEHYPGDAEKTKLKGIVDNEGSTAQERVLAAAISNLNHKVAAGDKGKLRQVMDDASAPAAVRELWPASSSI